MLTNKQRLILWGSLALILVVVAIVAFFWRRDQVAYKPVELVLEEQEQWNDLAIDSYVITVEEGAMPFSQIQFTIHVESGAIASAECVDILYEKECDVQDYAIENYTVAGLFVKAANLARRHGGSTKFNVVFDPEYHYPQRFSIYTEDSLDSVNTWTIKSFEVSE